MAGEVSLLSEANKAHSKDLKVYTLHSLGSSLFPKQPIKKSPLLCVVLVKCDQGAWNSLAFRPRGENTDTGRALQDCYDSSLSYRLQYRVFHIQLPPVVPISWGNFLATRIPLHVCKHLPLISRGNIQVHWNRVLHFPCWWKLALIWLHLLGFFSAVAD